MLRSLKWLRNKSTTLAYKCVNRVGPQNAESMNNIFNIRDTEVDICIMLVKRKRAVGLNHSLNIRQYTRQSLITIGKQ